MEVIQACEEFVDGVATKDVQLNESVWVRIFLPEVEARSQSCSNGGETEAKGEAPKQKPKPVVLYAHGGAYCFGQPDWPHYHLFCRDMAKLSACIWVSISYRLAPAHRLPAAYDDASFALRWLASQARLQISHSSDAWLAEELADFRNFFLCGESAGATIMLKTAMDAVLPDLAPIRVRGLILLQPGFHSEETSGVDPENEERYLMALPVGKTLSYGPINPVHPSAPPLTPLSAYPHIFLNVAGGDFRYKLTMRFYEAILKICPHVQLLISPGKSHAFHLDFALCPEASDLREQIASFINSCIAS
ncbi:hypothetical protein KP509_05G081900 [Ceratopteris richardii]|uniref:Alpha/beta hydrolase fold-3 domain-containing protein n=1 Tax=Ceratopteris richardii TaxID=49495 RepID=A0A8T2UVL3_CERRI|nr:hypothetical protein KP509_05G081900 [Ceratopteris richardii]